ncbi:transglutaminase family protein [Methylocucumis oryzae]|uniref:transglutaminase family protein n=1 Tax=Methylocucumis oryzae TaxID=1632867 RepID=UPI000A620356|nr:transglutaminase family protein [Methylocucumis oryzae]
MHYGQGKWYPGEPLPRWQYGIFWRKDHTPIWRNPELLADINTDYGHDIKDALAFTQELTRYLGVTESHITPAYEDSFYYLWQEGTLPTNLNPLKANLKRPARTQNACASIRPRFGYAGRFYLTVKMELV